MRPERLRHVAAFILVTVTIAPTWASTDAERDVWGMEEAYWRYVKAGDVEGYQSLWHEDFVGWTCLAAQPMRKEDVGDWIRQIRDGEFSVTYNLRREAVQSFGGVLHGFPIGLGAHDDPDQHLVAHGWFLI